MSLLIQQRFVAWLLLAVVARTDGGNDYLTADGKLRHALEIVELQEAPGSTEGTLYRVQTDGTWSVWTLSLRASSWKGSVSARGRLTDAQLARLAGELERHQLAGLRDHGTPRGDAPAVTIKHGRRVSTLRPGVDERAAQADAAVRARYAGILGAVKALCKH